MVDPQFRITYRGAMKTLMRKRQWNADVETPSWQAVGLYWNKRHKQKHFTPAGAVEYGYARRSKKYTEQKRRKFGHANPLEYTGQLKADCRLPEVRATSKRVRVVLRARKANLRNPKSWANPAAELRQVSEREAVELAREKDREMIRRIRAARGSYTKTL